MSKINPASHIALFIYCMSFSKNVKTFLEKIVKNIVFICFLSRFSKKQISFDKKSTVSTVRSADWILAADKVAAPIASGRSGGHVKKATDGVEYK